MRCPADSPLRVISQVASPMTGTPSPNACPISDRVPYAPPTATTDMPVFATTELRAYPNPVMMGIVYVFVGGQRIVARQYADGHAARRFRASASGFHHAAKPAAHDSDAALGKFCADLLRKRGNMRARIALAYDRDYQLSFHYQPACEFLPQQ